MGITRIHGGIENQSKGFLEYEKAFALSKKDVYKRQSGCL